MALTRQENIFLAKKLFYELVFNAAYIEGVNVTFPQTQAIIDGGIVNNVSVDDIQKVLNLRDAWRYALSDIDAGLTLSYICKVNEYVSRNESLDWGVLRSGLVGISGTSYQPPAPAASGVERELDRIRGIGDAIEQAIEYFCYGVYNQLFWDGNKRTSTIVASKILVENGEGLLSIGKEHAVDFNQSLLNYYDSGDSSELKNVLRVCIRNDLVR
jgi:Fic family protein